MYTIGEFAAFGRVSVRMLRHYDAIGLLTPASVDDRTGYRRYANEQLRDLLRIVDLRGLGCGLDEIAAVLAADDTERALQEALERRRDQLTASLAADTARLARIDERLRRSRGDTMSDITYRPLEEVTAYAVAGVAPGMGPENVSPLVGELLPRLHAALAAAGRVPREPGVFWYDSADGEALTVHVGFTADDEPVAGDGYSVETLPAVPLAAVLVHHGEMATIGDAWSRLVDGLVADGYRMTGPTREIYLVAEPGIPQSEWVTELQAPVALA